MVYIAHRDLRINEETAKDMQQSDINTVFSIERFQTYQKRAESVRCDPFELYEWNMRLSTALYPGLQTLEVALRNQIHSQLSRNFGAEWIMGNAPFLKGYQTKKIDRAYEVLSRNQNRRDNKLLPSQYVAGLSFGFWTSLFGRHHEDLWRTHLHRIIGNKPEKGVNRKDFSVRLDRLRKLRNRIAHYEPIVHMRLPQHQSDIKQLVYWLSPAADEWRLRVCRFDTVFSGYEAFVSR